ncbi:hypothetical protein [Desertivirga arenae]|uniref:hypothetical protein n=1 Tax=Desertivirga arenae TaxID=2810309 RepID=UPI001A96D2B8|nr:hypothetical protein [Pedobacter sp. SYSU D00823]
MNNILVFKTNIQSEEDLLVIERLLTGMEVDDWNVDRKDIDCVLRIVSNTVTECQISSLVTEAGFFCEELL